jgi:hypothetical protein
MSSHIKNVHFTKLIKVNGKLKEFNFRQLKDNMFHGDVNDDRGNRIMFKMKNEDGWKMEGNVPDWLKQQETVLGKAIEEGEV